MSEVLEALKALEQGSVKVCPVVRVAGELDPEAGEYVLKLLKTPSVSVRQIHIVLQSAKLAIARDSLTNHRKGKCICENE